MLGEVGHEDLRRRWRTDAQHELRLERCAHRRIAEQRVVRVDHQAAIVRSAAREGQRVGEDRKAGRSGQTGERRRQVRIVLRAADDETARRAAQVVRDPRDRVASGRPRTRHGQRAQGDHRRERRERARRRHERVAEREVEMHRSGRRGAGRRHRTRGERVRVARTRVGLAEHRNVDEPLRMRPVEPELIDRLRRAGIAQLGRAVGGEDDQRHAAVAGFDDRGKEVRRGGARGAEDGDRFARDLRQAEREESG